MSLKTSNGGHLIENLGNVRKLKLYWKNKENVRIYIASEIRKFCNFQSSLTIWWEHYRNSWKFEELHFYWKIQGIPPKKEKTQFRNKVLILIYSNYFL